MYLFGGVARQRQSRSEKVAEALLMSVWRCGGRVRVCQGAWQVGKGGGRQYAFRLMSVQ